MFEHIFDICFTVKTNEENPDDISSLELIEALTKRIASINTGEMIEACGFVDIVEV